MSALRRLVRVVEALWFDGIIEPLQRCDPDVVRGSLVLHCRVGSVTVVSGLTGVVVSRLRGGQLTGSFQRFASTLGRVLGLVDWLCAWHPRRFSCTWIRALDEELTVPSCDSLVHMRQSSRRAHATVSPSCDSFLGVGLAPCDSFLGFQAPGSASICRSRPSGGLFRRPAGPGLAALCDGRAGKLPRQWKNIQCLSDPLRVAPGPASGTSEFR